MFGRGSGTSGSGGLGSGGFGCVATSTWWGRIAEPSCIARAPRTDGTQSAWGPSMTTKNPDTGSKQEDAKREIVKKPGREDVHEQREPDQPREGVVTPGKGKNAPGAAPPVRPPKGGESGTSGGS